LKGIFFLLKEHVVDSWGAKIVDKKRRKRPLPQPRRPLPQPLPSKEGGGERERNSRDFVCKKQELKALLKPSTPIIQHSTPSN